jgi:hypothetical protein
VTASSIHDPTENYIDMSMKKTLNCWVDPVLTQGEGKLHNRTTKGTKDLCVWQRAIDLVVAIYEALIVTLAVLLIAIFVLVATRMMCQPSAAARHIRGMRDAVFHVAAFMGRPHQQISVDELLENDLSRIARTFDSAPDWISPTERLCRLQGLVRHARAFGCTWKSKHLQGKSLPLSRYGMHPARPKCIAGLKDSSASLRPLVPWYRAGLWAFSFPRTVSRPQDASIVGMTCGAWVWTRSLGRYSPGSSFRLHGALLTQEWRINPDDSQCG